MFVVPLLTQLRLEGREVFRSATFAWMYERSATIDAVAAHIVNGSQKHNKFWVATVLRG